ncbi:CsbD family protein [Roseomonas sp. OT10]|uniref:CsbD family protein n=1 Tax=Roseomonas cutis TaxID=2897332 RepID=UPI001E4223F1|nr:CsbD family protein [Roseomonas sp. OT10]UFN48038.1 CsbD family protein [Roseomonas sp. OT10]
MDSDRVTGAVRQGYGKLEEKVGEMTGNRDTQARGQMRQFEGQAQNAMGQLEDCIRDQPLKSALIALGIGWVLGRLRII